jgi:hypothetical protein
MRLQRRDEAGSSALDRLFIAIHRKKYKYVGLQSVPAIYPRAGL